MIALKDINFRVSIKKYAGEYYFVLECSDREGRDCGLDVAIIQSYSIFKQKKSAIERWKQIAEKNGFQCYIIIDDEEENK